MHHDFESAQTIEMELRELRARPTPATAREVAIARKATDASPDIPEQRTAVENDREVAYLAIWKLATMIDIKAPPSDISTQWSVVIGYECPSGSAI